MFCLVFLWYFVWCFCGISFGVFVVFCLVFLWYFVWCFCGILFFSSVSGEYFPVSTAYWDVGQMLHERKIESGYGDSVVRRLSADLKERYPKMGVSPRQLWNMKKFYERYAGHNEKVQRCVALLPWSHNMLLLSKGLDDDATLYYAQETMNLTLCNEVLLILRN